MQSVISQNCTQVVLSLRTWNPFLQVVQTGFPAASVLGQEMQSLIPQLGMQLPTVLVKSKGLNVLLPSQPHSAPLLMGTDPVGQVQVVVTTVRLSTTLVVEVRM